jgi:hypothetical protein
MQNRHSDVIISGVLRKEEGTVFIESEDGRRFFEDNILWKGYQTHWLNQKVNARTLPQKDYLKGQNIVLLWPFRETNSSPFIELYYNERLVKYPASLLGHIAINVNNEIFNFSHLLNENEIITPEEYFYRPALGEFSPHPEKKCFNTDDLSRPYYDKFGRNFMRTIHTARIEGVDTKRLSEYYKEQLRIIHATASNPRKPEKYRDFNFLSRSCTTIIRDGLHDIGFSKLKGIFPRDMFVSATWNFLTHHKDGKLKMTLFMMKQLKVEEAEYSKLSPLLNPDNVRKYRLLKKKGYNI